MSHTHILTPFFRHILESLSRLPVLTHQWQFIIWTQPKHHHLPPSHTFSLRVFFLSSVQSLSPVCLYATPWTAALQSSLSITNSRSLLRLMSIESVMPSSHLILCRLLLLPPSIFPSIRVFSSESFASDGQSIGVSASASALPMNIQDWSPLGLTGWISKGLSESSPTPQFKSINSSALSLL